MSHDYIYYYDDNDEQVDVLLVVESNIKVY